MKDSDRTPEHKARRVRDDAATRLERVRAILVSRGLIESDEELTEAMLEDLVHFAYFTGCITKKEARGFLDLTERQITERLRSWKQWQEGNRSCSIRQNTFYEGWTALDRERFRQEGKIPGR